MKWLTVLIAACAFLVVPFAHARNTGVTFVSSYEELNAALELAALGEIGSVAIDQGMYLDHPMHTMTSVRALIEDTLKLGDRAVYIYGQPFNEELAQELLGMKVPNFCSNSLFLGKRIRADAPGAPIVHCGISGDTSDEKVRARIIFNDERERKRFGQ